MPRLSQELIIEPERLPNQIRDEFSLEPVHLQVIFGDVLLQEFSIRRHAAPQMRRVERHVDAFERDGGDAALEFDWHREARGQGEVARYEHVEVAGGGDNGGC